MKKKNVLYWAVIALIIIAVIIPYGCVLFYTLPRSDEFSCLIWTHYGSHYSLSRIIDIVIEQYLQWEGNYSGVFMYIVLNPMLAGNQELAMYIYNIASYMFFVVVVVMALYRVMKIANLEKKYAFLLALITFSLSVNCRYMHETLGWFTGYTYYTLQMLCGIVAMMLVAAVSGKKEDKTKDIKGIVYTALAGILAFIGCGGTLQISGMLCFMTLVLLAWNIWRKRDWVKAAILFGFTLASTLFNLCAPGHYVRKGDYEEISIFKAVGYSIYCIFKELYRLCKETYFLHILLIVLLVALVLLKSGEKKLETSPLVTALCGFFCAMAGVLPVCYGYGSFEIAARGYEILDFTLAVFGCLTCVSIANSLKARGVELNKKWIGGAAAAICVLAAASSLLFVEDHSIPGIYCIENLANGNVKNYSDYWREVWRTVTNSPDEDVVISVDTDMLDCDEYVCRPWISENPNNWVNLSMTYFYHNNSIRIERAD